MIDDHSDTFIILCRTRTLRKFRLSGLQQWTREKAIRGEEKTAKLPRVRSDGFQTLSWVCWGRLLYLEGVVERWVRVGIRLIL